MLDKIKAFFMAHTKWLLIPLIIAVVLWLYRRVKGWLSPAPNLPPVAVPSKKEVEAAKDAIEKAADDKKDAIQRDNADIKQKIIDKFGKSLFILCLLSWSCADVVVRPTVTSAPLEGMIAQCQRSEELVTCPRPLFSAGLQSWADCLSGEAECQVSLEETRGLAGVDLGAAVARAQNAEGLLAQERNRKWVWGVVGVAGGLILGAGIVSVAVFGK
jgi:hypothetical protein